MGRIVFKEEQMTKIISVMLSVLTLALATPALAVLNVFACEPEWASLVDELGGERVKTYSATTAFQDPHHIEARPSLIAKVRRADLVICSGAELETGWLPLLQRQAGNNKVLPGRPGYFEAAAMIKRLDVQVEVDRSMGDVHASGNPHVHLDPRRILAVAEKLSARLIEIDSEGMATYEQRMNDFKTRWQQAIKQWQQQAASLKGKRIVVHHRDWVYLFDWLDIEIAGSLEPKPGLPTTVGHLVSLKRALVTNPAAMIVHTSYQNPRAAKRLSQMTGIPVVELPYTVGGSEEVKDLFSLFEITIKKMKGVF